MLQVYDAEIEKADIVDIDARQDYRFAGMWVECQRCCV